MLRLLVQTAFVLVIFSSYASAASSQTISLDNGLTVLISPMQSAQTVSICALVKAGAATEGEMMGTGVSHFVEHMLFKGTATRPVGSIAKEIKSLGGRINASTDLDTTVYTIDVPKQNYRQAIAVLADMLSASVFDPAEVEKERQVIHAEMRLYNDRPERQLSMDVFKNVYIQHPYRYPTIGYEDLFDTITRDQLYGYYKRFYVPNNIVLSIAGDVEIQSETSALNKLFKDFKRGPYPVRNLVSEPAQISPRYLEHFYDTPVYRFSLAFASVPINHPDVFALDVLAYILGHSSNSKLYKLLFKDKKLVTQVSCANYTPQDKGIFECLGVSDKDNLEAVIKEFQNEINHIAEQGVNSIELKKASQALRVQSVFDNLTTNNVAYRNVSDYAATGDASFFEQYVKSISKVSNADIKRVARQYLMNQPMNITYLKPLHSTKAVEIKPQQSMGDFTKIDLENGLTVLYRVDHSSPMVAMYALLKGGLWQEEKEHNGVSTFFAQVWGRANKKYSDKVLQDEMARRGVSFGADANRNSFYLYGKSLTEDAPFILELMTQSLTQPDFDDKVIEEVRSGLLSVIAEEDDDIKTLTNKSLLRQLYRKHPFGMPPNGTKATISAIQKKDLKNYFRNFVHPDNLVISVVGDINEALFLKTVHARWAKWPKEKTNIKEIKEEAINSQRQEVIPTKKEQAMISIGFHAPGGRDHERYAMEQLSAVLGSGLNSRLFVKVRDQLGKAYTVGASYNPGVDSGTIAFFALTTPSKVDSVKALLEKEIKDIQLNLITDEEFNAAKAYLKGNFNFSIDSPAVLAVFAGSDELFGLGFERYKKYASYVDAVTKEDIKKVAIKYLDLNRSAVVITTSGVDHE